MKFIEKREAKEMAFLKKVGKKFLSKSTYVKILKLEDLSEKADVFKYAIKTALEKRYSQIKKKTKSLEKKKKDVFFLLIKGNLLNLKIKYFNVTFRKHDFKVIMKLFKSIEKDLENV